MIGSITPVGYGRSTRVQWLIAMLFYCVSAGFASAIVAMLAASIGLLARLVLPGIFVFKWPLLACISILYCLHALRLIRMPTPQRKRQVPSSWRSKYHLWVFSAGYGFMIGAGLLTWIATPIFYVFMAWSFLDADLLTAGSAGALYGLCQGMVLLLVGLRLTSLHHAFEIGKKDWSLRFMVHKVGTAFLSGIALYSIWVSIAGMR